MPTLFDKDVKDALTRYEGRHTPRFRTFQILEKKIENVVQNSIRLWKEIFNVVDLDDKEVEKEKEEEEKDEKEEEKNEEESEEPEVFVQVTMEDFP